MLFLLHSLRCLVLKLTVKGRLAILESVFLAAKRILHRDPIMHHHYALPEVVLASFTLYRMDRIAFVDRLGYAKYKYWK